MSRSLLVAAVACALVVGLAVLLTREEAEQPTRQQPSAPSPAPAPNPLPTPQVAASPDAGPRSAPDAAVQRGAVTLVLLREGTPQVGPRLVLRNAAGESDSRTTDVMGEATFELAVGDWLVMEPRELKSPTVHVSAERQRVTLELPRARKVEGVVLDHLGAPLAGVAVMMSAVDDDMPDVVARSDEHGRFSFETIEEWLKLTALRGTSRAEKAVAPPVSGVELRLEATALLRVRVPVLARPTVDLTWSNGALTRPVLDGDELRVPVRPLEVRALSVERGQLLRAAHHVEPRPDGAFDELTLAFQRAPPITGLVRGPDGHPLAGVTVGLKLAPSRSNEPPRTQETTLTDAAGRFELVPRIVRGGDPVYEVHLLPPWREQRPTLVRLGDASLVVDALQ